jgi:hypothetical protein
MLDSHLLETDDEPPCVERRIQADRRARPTSFWSALRPTGLRMGFRRRGEALNQYVDCLPERVTVLAISVVVLSILDAMFTLLHLQNGGREINPVMELALFTGVPFFLFVKTSLTDLGVIFLAIHQNFRIGRAALRVTAAGYAVLILYHAALLLRVAA